MGTHPIFESDFDCLTEMNRLGTGCARLSLRLGQRPVLSQTSKRTAFDMGPFGCSYRWPAYHDPVISLLGQIAVGIIWTYFLYNCWNHSNIILFKQVSPIHLVKQQTWLPVTILDGREVVQSVLVCTFLMRVLVVVKTFLDFNG